MYALGCVENVCEKIKNIISVLPRSESRKNENLGKARKGLTYPTYTVEMEMIPLRLATTAILYLYKEILYLNLTPSPVFFTNFHLAHNALTLSYS